ncbi:MAG: hypothetical protein HQ526_05815, partial [Actinobacteria bacterium]|nr:hypothetical protein [Actinomycetota bacterium]
INDVPGSFSKNPSRSLDYAKGANTFRFEMCVDANGDKVFGKKPAQEMNSTVSLLEELDGDGEPIKQRVVSSDIYGYTSARAAKKAWNKLNKARTRCAKKINEPFDLPGVSLSAIVKQKTAALKTTNGAPGFAVKQRVFIDIGTGAPDGIQIYLGGYTNYRYVGTTIQRVQFANLTNKSRAKSAIKPNWAAFTRQESITIADRVARLRVRN